MARVYLLLEHAIPAATQRSGAKGCIMWRPATHLSPLPCSLNS